MRSDDLREEFSLGPRNQIRLGDLQSWHVLRAACLHCNHVATVPTLRLRHRWGPNTGIVALEKRLRCTRCGGRAMNSLRVYKLPRNM